MFGEGRESYPLFGDWYAFGEVMRMALLREAGLAWFDGEGGGGEGRPKKADEGRKKRRGEYPCEGNERRKLPRFIGKGETLPRSSEEEKKN